MKLSQFTFNLPKELIAEHPARYRDESRLMVLHRKTGKIEHREFKDIMEYFEDGDRMVINDTKVFPARLYGNKEKTGAKIEVFLLRELNRESRLWDVLVDPARKIRIGNKLYFGDDDSYIPPVQKAAAIEADPVPRLRARLIADRVATEAELAAVEADIEAQIDDAVAFALASPWPEPDALRFDVFETEIAA